MKIDDRYEIRLVIVEIREGVGRYNSYGDVYNNFDKFKKDKPNSGYKYGYVVFDTKIGYVPENCNDWNDSPEEAMMDYEENCQG